MNGRRIAVTGTVQGVGFRPWVYRVARELGLAGKVRNDAGGVVIDAFGAEASLEALVDRLGREAPGRVRTVAWQPVAEGGAAPDGFHIDTSTARGAVALSIPPDLSTCADCLREVDDPADRRFRYPFTNCTYCGPRFTIALDLPYDRPATTMAGFPLCAACGREYGDPADRRFHAQPIACPRCGPRLVLEVAGDPSDPIATGDDALRAAADLLRGGKIVAVKGLGGFHLACDATSAAAVRALRDGKRRDHRPFAVMVADVAAAEVLADLDEAERALLTSPERPITLVRRRAPGAGGLAAEVSPDTPLLGLFLPYTPLHHLLLAAAGRPLVMTSGNRSDEPIATDDGDARARLAPLCDALLLHDRPIATRCDDSVARVIAGAPMILRRSRGYVPRAVALRHPVARPILATGAHLKNTFCLAHGASAYLGPHVGDLDNLLAFEFFAEAVERMERLVHVRPEVIAHDLHPDYASSRYAAGRDGEHVAVQHHHAHVAAVMAEHGLAGPVLGLAWDGSGLGTDGTSWGTELLLADAAGFQRLGTLRPIALAGGDAAVGQVWRIALALLDDAFDGAPPLDRLPVFAGVTDRDLRVVRQMIARDLNTPRVHGLGRLFDGLGALGLGRPRAHHEGQVAMAWNHAAEAAPPGAGLAPYPYRLDPATTPWQLDHRPLVRAAVGDLVAGVAPERVAARFHRTIVDAGAAMVRLAAGVHGRLPVVLGGGCFQNPLITEGLLAALADLEVHVPRAAPPGDGGLALGQVLIAAAGARESCV